MELIGTGSFSKVYKKGNKVYIKSNDPAKECMALGWFPNSRLFPKVKFTNEHGFDYEMKYYKKHTSLKKALKPIEWEKYQELRKFMFSFRYGNNPGLFFNDLIQGFNKLKNKTLKKALIGAVEAMGNYGGDVMFEISPRNVSVSDTGGLVLLDCFFMQSMLKKTNKYN